MTSQTTGNITFQPKQGKSVYLDPGGIHIATNLEESLGGTGHNYCPEKLKKRKQRKNKKRKNLQKKNEQKTMLGRSIQLVQAHQWTSKTCQLKTPGYHLYREAKSEKTCEDGCFMFSKWVCSIYEYIFCLLHLLFLVFTAIPS